jgi:hypothetical protein
MNLRIAVSVTPWLLLGAIGCRDVTSPTVIDFGLRVSVWVPDSAAELATTAQSGFSGAMRSVVSDSKAWASTWRQFSCCAPAPDVDFTRDRVLVAALGRRSTAGYAITIDSAVGFDAGTVVYVTAFDAGGCLEPQVETQPAQAVRLPQPLEPISFLERSVRIC